jgi:hypothetical protein
VLSYRWDISQGGRPIASNCSRPWSSGNLAWPPMLRRGLNRLHNFDPIPTVWRHESEEPGDMIRLDALESR